MTISYFDTRYVFKPLKMLTACTLFFTSIRLITLGAYLFCLIYQLISLGGDNLSLDGFYGGFIGVAYLIGRLHNMAYIVSGFVSLVWIYGAARNALALRPGADVSPWGAVLWFFVPFANLFKPYQAMKAIWIASLGGFEEGNEPSAVLSWWIFTIIGNILLVIAERLLNRASGGPGELIAVIMAIGFIFIGTWLFFILVKRLHALQMMADTRVANTF